MKMVAMDPRQSDIQLCKRAALGDASALTALFHRFNRPLYGYLLTLMRDSALAQDLLQTVFLRLIKFPESLQKSSSPRSFLFTIARHEALRLKEQRSRTQSLAVLPEEIVQPGPEVEKDREELLAALRRIPEEQSEAILLKFYEDLSYTEMSEVLEVSPKTCESRFRLGMAKLRELLKT